ncbi:hypothetical protein MX634_16390 [Carnobacterium maltaromaticum]|uniref:hypothetical protein n=1 Tax=Carnobacterium TaxID=2747 RepID=UPI0012FA0740|nr:MULTISPECIES: hypothetical protein [Carnobacterium]MDT1946516.1 hypothetical protein [Carnobacterium maltaromaticum]MDT2000883.1 hypothetical protein [Carnobacterium maltaromaticum]
MDINLGNIDNHSAIYRVGIGEIVTVVWLEFDDEGNFYIKMNPIWKIESAH